MHSGHCVEVNFPATEGLAPDVHVDVRVDFSLKNRRATRGGDRRMPAPKYATLPDKGRGKNAGGNALALT